MDADKLQALHDTLNKLKGRQGLGVSRQYSWQKIHSGIQRSLDVDVDARANGNNPLYALFHREGAFPSSHHHNTSGHGDGRIIKRSFDDITSEPSLSSCAHPVHDDDDEPSSIVERKKRKKEEKKAAKTAAKIEAKRQAKLEEKRRAKREAKALIAVNKLQGESTSKKDVLKSDISPKCLKEVEPPEKKIRVQWPEE